MSFSLKHLPCPAGNKCTAFQCIFGHESDKATAPTGSSSGDQGTGPPKVTEAQLSSDQDRPRKRVKLDGTESSHPTRGSSENPVASSAAGASGKTNSAGDTRAVSHKLPSKTPRAAQPTTEAKKGEAQTSSKKLATSHSTSTQSASSSTSKAAPPPKPKKAESLNPRLLKSSPAAHDIRLKLLKLAHAELKRLNTELKKSTNEKHRKLALSDQDLITRCLDEEQACAIEKPAVYSNVMKNKVMQYKRMAAQQWREMREKEVEEKQKKQEKEELIDGEPKKIITGLTHSQEARILQRILTPIDQLHGHGYVAAVPSDDTIQTAREGIEASKGWEKCDRCQQRFQVFPGRREEDGALTTGGACKFHYGKVYVPDKLPGDRTRVPKRYHCCGQEVGDSAGCFTHHHHVFKASDSKRLATILNFAETPENDLVPASRAVCFDCEMCYTVHGMELVRLTATSWPTGRNLLDVLVQPFGEILDLNSRFSGVWPDDLTSAEAWSPDDSLINAKSENESGSEDGEIQAKKKPLKIVSSPEVARDLLFSLISPKTPLIGHGLENDLNAVRIVHPTVIDTVLLYPHKMGLPYRYGLKMLMNAHLNRKIQQETGSKVVGHDSAEDANAAGELVRLRVMDVWNDMRRKGWEVVDDEFVPPANGEHGLSEAFLEKKTKTA